MARRQVEGGAQIVDVCLQSTERDEVADIAPFYERITPGREGAAHDRLHRPAGGGAALT